MSTLKFEIEEIHAGWFVFRLGDVTVWSSNIWEHDSPRELLRMLAAGKGYTVFDEEPGTHVLSVDGCSLKLWYSEKSSHEWPESELHGGASVPEWIGRGKLLLQVEHLDCFGFACSAADAFAQTDRAEYCRHWMDFPEEELAELTEKLRILKMFFGARYDMLLSEMPHGEIRHFPE